MRYAYIIAAALTLASAPVLGATYNKEHVITVREAVDVLNGLSEISRGYVCGEDVSPPNPNAASLSMKQPRYCQYKFEGVVIMKITRNLDKLKKIVEDASNAQTTILQGYATDGSKPTAIGQLPPEKQPEALQKINALVEATVPFEPERFVYSDFKLGSGPGQNQISPNDLLKISRLIDEDNAPAPTPEKALIPKPQ